MSENGEIYTDGKNFTLPPALTALTSSTSGHSFKCFDPLKTHDQKEACQKLYAQAFIPPSPKWAILKTQQGLHKHRKNCERCPSHSLTVNH